MWDFVVLKHGHESSQAVLISMILIMSSTPGVEIKPNFPLARGMSSPEKLLVPKKNH